MLPFAGWIEIELRLLEFTVSVVLSFTDSKLPEIVVLPIFLAVTNPLTVTVAIDVADEFQLVTSVTS